MCSFHEHLKTQRKKHACWLIYYAYFPFRYWLKIHVKLPHAITKRYINEKTKHFDRTVPLHIQLDRVSVFYFWMIWDNILLILLLNSYHNHTVMYIYKVYNMLYQLFLNTPTKLLIHFGLINHLVKRTKNATWKKNTMTPISCTTWPAALDPSSTPVIFLNGVVGVGVVEGGHPSRGHGGQSRGRFGFSGAHSGRGPPPPPPPPGPIPEFTQWQR